MQPPKRHNEENYRSLFTLANHSRLWRPSIRVGSKRYAFSKRLLLIVAAAVVVGLYALVGSTSAVPKKIQQAVPFSVYYPAQLPPGYVLDMTSFRLPDQGVVLFTVTYGKGKDIIFSEQQQPSRSDIDKFVSNYIPLNTALQFAIGQANVGAYSTAPSIRTVVSLPIHNGPWLIITAPSEVSRSDMVKILESLSK
jgi:hypothetical protein